MCLPPKIIGLLVIVANIQTSVQNSYLPIINGLNLINPYYVVETFDFQQRNIIKHHSKKSEPSMVCENANNIPVINKEKIQSIIQIANSVKDIATVLEPLLYFEFPTFILIITNSLQKNNLKTTKILIHQQILFYFENTQELFETYTINDSNIVRRLGIVKEDLFQWDKDVIPNFVRRRSNFQGLTLKVMVEFEGNSMNANSSYITNAPYFPENETYLLNGYTYGVFHDVLNVLQGHLNFSAQLFKRKDGAWGMVYPQDDGTFKTVGFIGDLFLKKADFAIGNVIIFQTRAQFVDYLPAVGVYQGKYSLQQKPIPSYLMTILQRYSVALKIHFLALFSHRENFD